MIDYVITFQKDRVTPGPWPAGASKRDPQSRGVHRPAVLFDRSVVEKKSRYHSWKPPHIRDGGGLRGLVARSVPTNGYLSCAPVKFSVSWSFIVMRGPES